MRITSLRRGHGCNTSLNSLIEATIGRSIRKVGVFIRWLDIYRARSQTEKIHTIRECSSLRSTASPAGSASAIEDRSCRQEMLSSGPGIFGWTRWGEIATRRTRGGSGCKDKIECIYYESVR